MKLTTTSVAVIALLFGASMAAMPADATNNCMKCLTDTTAYKFCAAKSGAVINPNGNGACEANPATACTDAANTIQLKEIKEC